MGIEAQLENGVRGFLIDAFLGSPRMAGDEQIIYTDLTDSRLARLVKAAGDVPAQHALALRAEAGPPAADAPSTSTSATSSVARAVLFSDVVDVMHRFLEAHPHEVLVVVIQDELAADEPTPVLEDGGLARTWPRSTRPSRCHPRVDGGVGASAGDRSRERRPRSGHPQRVRRRARPGGALQVPLGGGARARRLVPSETR